MMKSQSYLEQGSCLHGNTYRIVNYIGSGGFGCTYEAEHIIFRNRVAIKEFFINDFCNRDSITGNVVVATESKRELVEKLKKKFIEEAVALHKMSHPNIVKVTDVFEENGTFYYVMDYIEGISLKEMVDQSGPLEEQRALGYIFQVCDALKYVHDRKRLHLDIKPGNIMVDPQSNAILIDFGVSKQYDELNGENTSTIMGNTPGYAPPEQMGNDIVEFAPAADIYSLGATLYTLLTGVKPVSATLRISKKNLLVPLPESITESTKRTISASMELDESNRPQSIEEFMAMLDTGSAAEEPIVAKLVEDDSDVTEHRVKESDSNKEKERADDRNSSAVHNHTGTQGDKKVVPLRKIVGIVAAVVVLLGLIFIVGGKINEKIIMDNLQSSVGGEENGHEWVDLGLSVKWATCNVEANSPSDYGNYYAWGETTTKSEYTKENSKTYGKSIGDISGDPSYDAARANWGGNWCLPTKVMMEELIEKCVWKWRKIDGVYGYLVTGPNGNSIFLPAAGRYFLGNYSRFGEDGFYYNSTPNESDTSRAYYLRFYNGDKYVESILRNVGLSIRPILCDEDEVEEVVGREQVQDAKFIVNEVEHQIALDTERKSESAQIVMLLQKQKDSLEREQFVKDGMRKAQESEAAEKAERERQAKLVSDEEKRQAALEAERKAEADRKAKEDAAHKAEESRKVEQEHQRHQAATSKGVHQGHEWVDLGLSVKWATCNVGANSPSDYGNHYAWGETTTKSKYTFGNSKTYGKSIGAISGDPSYDAARANWGGKWRLPTKSEFEELKNKCQWQWTSLNGHNGYRVTGPNGNSIFLPTAGLRAGDSLIFAGGCGNYWSSSPDEGNADYAYHLYFSSNIYIESWDDRRDGFSIRPVLE